MIINIFHMFKMKDKRRSLFRGDMGDMENNPNWTLPHGKCDGRYFGSPRTTHMLDDSLTRRARGAHYHQAANQARVYSSTTIHSRASGGKAHQVASGGIQTWASWCISELAWLHKKAWSVAWPHTHLQKGHMEPLSLRRSTGGWEKDLCSGSLLFPVWEGCTAPPLFSGLCFPVC